MDIANLIQTVALYALPVLFAITVHEAAHGYVARHFGDNTAYMLGRVTLNPLKHIDPVGTIAMPLLLYFATSGRVPVRLRQAGAGAISADLRNPKRDMIWVALAGPGANLIQALLWGVLFYVLVGAGVTEPFFIKMCQGGMLVNLVMFAFNLFPLPPLDGGRILVGLLPYKQAALVSRVEPWGFFIVMALVISGVVSTLWLLPLMSLTLCSYRYRAHAPVACCCAADIVTGHESSTSSVPTRFLTGITTSGTPHLGNYVGAIRPAVARQPRGRGGELLFPGRLPRADQDATNRRASSAPRWRSPPPGWPRAGPGASVDLLPPVRHPGNPRAHLAADLRHRQGPAQPRPRLQGRGRQEQRRRRGPRCRHHRRPVHVPGADGAPTS